MMHALNAKILFNSDRRAAERVAMNQQAKALVPNAPEAVNCVILDLSSTGARIELPTTETFIPRKMKLYFAEMHAIADCTQIWRKGREIGLAFSAVTNFEQTLGAVEGE